MIYTIKIVSDGEVMNVETITAYLKKDKRITKISYDKEGECIIAQCKYVFLEDTFKSFVNVFQTNNDKNKLLRLKYYEDTKKVY